MRSIAFRIICLLLAGLAVLSYAAARDTRSVRAGTIVAATSWSPSSVLVGGSATSTVNFYGDQPGAPSVSASVPAGLSFTASSVVLANNAAVSCLVQAAGLGSQALTLNDAGCINQTAATARLWAWTVTVTCQTPGNYTATFTSQLATVQQAIACLTSAISGTNTISIRNVDQFGQSIQGGFSIQSGPFWVDVAEIYLDYGSGQNPCATDGSGGASCVVLGNVSPQTFPQGLPNGTYRLVQITSTTANATCTLVSAYNGSAFGSSTQPGFPVSTFAKQLPLPVQVTLPDANPLDLQITFVNSCVTPGAPSSTTSQMQVIIGGSTPGITNRISTEIYPAPGSDSNARVDLYVADAQGRAIPNAHVTFLIDKGSLAVRRDLSTFPAVGYTVQQGSFGSTVLDGDTCDQATNGWLTQSSATGSYTWPFNPASRQQQDGYTSIGGVISACVYVDPILAPGTTPGTVNVKAIIESPAQGGLYNGSTYYNPVSPNNLSLPNYLAATNLVLTTTIPVVGPPASITVSAQPTTVNCGQQSAISVTVKDAAGQDVSDHTRVEFVTNYGGVLAGTAATLGPMAVTGGQVYPISSSSAETMNGVASAYLLTSTDHVGPYEVVASAGGSSLATNGYLAPSYNTTPTADFSDVPPVSVYIPRYAQGLIRYTPSTPPVTAQASVKCGALGATAAAPAPLPGTTAPPTIGLTIRPPNTGDGGLLP